MVKTLWRKTRRFKRWSKDVTKYRKTRRSSSKSSQGSHDDNDMCKQTDFCKKTKDIPRKLMPQIYNPKAFAKKIRKCYGVKSRILCVPVAKLSPSQNEINEDRVDDIIKELKDESQKPSQIVTSKDNFIVDGHHRWAAYKKYKPDMCIRSLVIDLPIHDALGLASVLETKREAF